MFSEKVWKLLEKIPKGKITTYGEIARALKSSPRAVGQAVKRNPTPVVVPCHRVVKSDGNLGGFTSKKYRKDELLKKEGIKIKNGKIQDFEKVLFRFTRT